MKKKANKHLNQEYRTNLESSESENNESQVATYSKRLATEDKSQDSKPVGLFRMKKKLADMQAAHMNRQNFLQIRNLKKISKEITLTNLGSVNYLVGKNGQGKSSILTAVSYLNSNIKKAIFLKDDSSIAVRINEKSLVCSRLGAAKKRKSVLTGELRVAVCSLSMEAIGHQTISFDVPDYSVLTKEALEFLNQSNELLGFTKLEPVRVLEDSDPWSDKAPQIRFKENGGFVETSMLSQGLISVNNLRELLNKAIATFDDRSDYEKIQWTILVLLEEPENNLHPAIQKNVPTILSNFIQSLPDEWKSRVLLFVSTHSPFIVSAASNFEEQKVYMVEDGQLLNGKLEKVFESAGYRGYECAEIVGQMLGADVTDLGYPVNYCILEEYSLQVILDDCKKKNIIKNFQFVSASGASRQVSFEATVRELSNLNTLIKCNPYYVDKYILIMDNVTGLGPKEKAKIDGMRNRLGNRFKELQELSLEDYYRDFDSHIYEDAVKLISESTGRDKGIAKEQAAIKISQKIKTKADFSKLFRNELDFLLI